MLTGVRLGTYESHIQRLEYENRTLRDMMEQQRKHSETQRIKLILNTCREMDRLRHYVRALQSQQQTSSKNRHMHQDHIHHHHYHHSDANHDMVPGKPPSPSKAEHRPGEAEQEDNVLHTICMNCGHDVFVNARSTKQAYAVSSARSSEASPGVAGSGDNHHVHAEPSPSQNGHQEHEHAGAQASSADGRHMHLQVGRVADGYDPNMVYAMSPNAVEHEDDEKQTTLSFDEYEDDDDDEEMPLAEYEQHTAGSQMTPGRVSRIMKPGTHVTHGNSVHLTAADLPQYQYDLGNAESAVGEHADIPLPANFMDDSFVICSCTSQLALQFVRKYPDAIECSKCLEFFEFIFLCNECGKCVCSECYDYEAKMQSIERITQHLHEPNHDKFGSDDQRSLDLIGFQRNINDEAAAILHRVILHNSQAALQIDAFELKLCYVICSFVHPMVLCQMLQNTDLVTQLFHLYWSLSPPKVSTRKKFGYCDINLTHTLQWNENTQWSIRGIMDTDTMVQNFLGADFRLITFHTFLSKLTRYMNETSTNYERLLDSLQLVLKQFDVEYCEELEYKEYAWRELGGAPSLCSRGMYFVWNIPALKRSFCFNVNNRILD